MSYQCSTGNDNFSTCIKNSEIQVFSFLYFARYMCSQVELVIFSNIVLVTETILSMARYQAFQVLK